jgi:hypothetical protein
MGNKMKLIFVPSGFILGWIIALTLKQVGILGGDFDGRWVSIALGLGGLVLGHHIDNKRECAQSARELDEERALGERIESAYGRGNQFVVPIADKHPTGKLLLSKSGVTRFLFGFSCAVRQRVLPKN